jgi:uncharacterized RDD family membrane protein YckC
VSARGPDKRLRALTTPEGLAMPVTLAGPGARAAALALDLGLIAVGFIAILLLLYSVGLGLDELDIEGGSPVLEFIVVVLLIAFFLSRYAYFLFFELGPRGATPGKRALGIRVAARAVGGRLGRLTAEAVIARNLLRDAELFLPLAWITVGLSGELGVAGAAAAVWLLVFALFPFFNRDALRAGDLVAGTWVIESRRPKLAEAMSVGEDRSGQYAFGEAELATYGEHELQVLERVLRENRPEALRQVSETVCAKFGWVPGAGDEREFLEAFYAALRARLERDMRFGRRKKDKFS